MKANNIRVNNPSHYDKVHNWIKKQRGFANRCEIDNNHQSTRFDWANISRKYLIDINDWIMLCKQCHKIFDEKNLTVEQLRQQNEERRKLLEKIDKGEVDFSKNTFAISHPKFIKFTLQAAVHNKEYLVNKNSSLTRLRRLRLEYLKAISPTVKRSEQVDKHVHIRGITYAEYFD